MDYGVTYGTETRGRNARWSYKRFYRIGKVLALLPVTEMAEKIYLHIESLKVSDDCMTAVTNQIC